MEWRDEGSAFEVVFHPGSQRFPRGRSGPWFLLWVVLGALVLSSGCKCPLPAPPVVIDIHTHLFNARYLPIKGIAESRGIPSDVAGGLEFLVLHMAGDSHLTEAAGTYPEDPEETELDFQLLKRIPTLTPPEARKQVIQRIQGRLSKAGDPLKGIKGLALSKTHVDEIHALRRFARRALLAPKAEEPLTAEELVQVLEEAGLLTDTHSSEAHPLILRGTLGTVEGYIAFFFSALSSERTLLKAYHVCYPEVTLSVHEMMDMAATYGTSPEFPFQDQVSKMLALQGEAEPPILTFAAFDPFRRKDALAIAQASFTKGVVGFKFYPPDGYRPAGNEIPSMDHPKSVDSEWNSRYLNLTNKELDEWNDQFFCYCQANEIPILVHCTPSGMEAVTSSKGDPGYGTLMASPYYWKTVLASHPTLRVCFGHSGGAEFWFNRTPVNGDPGWTFGDEVLALCETYPNVYCDAAYWETLLTDNGVQRLQERLRDLTATRPTLKSRLMYGTDWWMIAMEPGHSQYLHKMVDVFADPSLKSWRDSFFAGNAARFLNLKKLGNDPRLDLRIRGELIKIVDKVDEVSSKFVNDK
jgi:predicted TIM-barrel fold metal-dependent hydrolase